MGQISSGCYFLAQFFSRRPFFLPNSANSPPSFAQLDMSTMALILLSELLQSIGGSNVTFFL